MIFKIINFIAFYIIWFACLGGALAGWPWLGPIVTIIYLIYHFIAVEDHYGEIKLVIVVSIVGLIVDTANIHFDIYQVLVANHLYPLAPMWLIALWAMFGSTFKHSLSWLRKRYFTAVFLGALAGPAAYWAGARIGLIAFPDIWHSMYVISILWAMILPLFVHLTEVFCYSDGIDSKP